MKYRTRRLVAISAALALVAGGGAAYAAGASHAGAKGAGAGRGSVVRAVSSYLGLTPKQLGADLVAGQSLAQIATAQGKSVSGLEQTIESAVKSRLDTAVAAGKLTAAQEQKLLAALQSRLDTLVNKSHPFAGVRHGLKARSLVSVVAGYLGVTAQQLKTELMAGKSLAQIATEHGKTVAGLEQTITSAAKTRLDQAVAAGLISAQTEQQILNRLAAHLDTLVHKSFTH
jgi:hypothetical protein